MTQNIYDDPDFFAGYSRLPRSVGGLDEAAEWPSMRALLPDLAGKRVVDLGCGFGWFARWARARGAASVLGIDVSEAMLGRARAMTRDDGIVYARADLETLSLAEAGFDLAYSSLALHYVENLAGVVSAVHRGLVPGGRLVLSIEHPIYMAPRDPDWRQDAHGGRIWPLDHYLVEGPRRTVWLAEGVIKQHQTLGTTLNRLIAGGLSITHVEEWGPTDAQVAAHPDWAESRDRPMFLLIAARR